MFLGLTGCETITNVSVEELNNINNKIKSFFIDLLYHLFLCYPIIIFTRARDYYDRN